MVKILGAGTIEKLRKDSHRVRFNLGFDKIAKKYRYSPWRHVSGNKAKAEKAKAEYRNELENGIKADADKITFGEYIDQYLKQRKAAGELAPSTQRQHFYLSNMLKRIIGDIPIRDIDASTVKAVMVRLSDEGRGTDCVRRVYKMLHQVLKEATIDDLILRDPCMKVKTPKTEKPELSYLNTEEVARLLAALEATETEGARLMTLPPVRKDAKQSGGQLQGISLLSRCIAVRIALATGTRRGEALGLVWGCVDFEKNNVRIVQQMTVDGTRKPKTERGKRIVSLDAGTVERLKGWKQQQSEYLLSLGIAQNTDTPVVTDELGGFHDPSHFSNWWRDFCAKNGFGAYYDDNGNPIPPPRYNEQGQQVDEQGRCYSRVNKKPKVDKHYEGLRFHHLRHTQATLLIGDGMDIKTVQGRLGHTLASTTLDLYASVMPEKDREAADFIGSILDQKPPEMGKVVSL
jgi:integrase